MPCQDSWAGWNCLLCVLKISLISGLRLAEQLGRREDEAKIRHGLGLSLWASGNLEEAQHQVSGGTPVPGGFCFQKHGRPWDYCPGSDDICWKVL